jgi:hypothetical protein
VPRDINLDSSVKSAPVGGESPKVDKPPRPQVEKTVPEPPKPPSQKDARGSPGVGGAPPSPTRAASSHNPRGYFLKPGANRFAKASPLSPWSYGLGFAGRYQPGEGSSVPQSGKKLHQHSRAVESLGDNPEFIQARFHIRRFITTIVDTEADRRT